jgi:hypothetical protein
MQLDAIAPILSKDEKKQAQAMQVKLGVEERRIQSQADTDKTIQNLMLEASKNGAPQSILNNVSKSTSVTEAIQKMGAYSTDPLDRAIKSAQLTKINYDIQRARAENVVSGIEQSTGLRSLNDTQYSKFTASPAYKNITAGVEFKKALEDYKKAVEKYGTADFSATGKAQLNSTYQTVVGRIKDYYQLGTLDGGVEKLVALGIPAPGKFRIRDKKVISGLNTQIGQVDNSVNNAFKEIDSSPFSGTYEVETLKEIAKPPTAESYANTVEKTYLSPSSNIGQAIQAGYNMED